MIAMMANTPKKKGHENETQEERKKERLLLRKSAGLLSFLTLG